jgi:hypothetical protein
MEKLQSHDLPDLPQAFISSSRLPDLSMSLLGYLEAFAEARQQIFLILQWGMYLKPQ